MPNKVDIANIVQVKRKRLQYDDEVNVEAPPKRRVKEKGAQTKTGPKPGDAISVAPELFVRELRSSS